MAEYLHTMVRITDPEGSRAFYEALVSRACKSEGIEPERGSPR